MYHSEPVVKIIDDTAYELCSNNEETYGRITTFELQYWRAILPELNTHRTFSRCTLSNRAMPTEKLIESVKMNPWGPNHFFKNCKGMVSTEEYSPFETNVLKDVYAQLASSTASGVESVLRQLKERGLDSIHKQTVNRLLEPYQSVKTVLTADNVALEEFFRLRCAKDAQPEMQDLANKMKEVYEAHTPLYDEDIHCPYVTAEEIRAYIGNDHDPQEGDDDIKEKIMDILKASAMRCARVSYDKLDGTKSSIIEDARSCEEKLIAKGHMSPLEMPCVIDSQLWEQLFMKKEITFSHNGTNFNFPFVQLRKLIENNLDSSVL